MEDMLGKHLSGPFAAQNNVLLQRRSSTRRSLGFLPVKGTRLGLANMLANFKKQTRVVVTGEPQWGGEGPWKGRQVLLDPFGFQGWEQTGHILFFKRKASSGWTLCQIPFLLAKEQCWWGAARVSACCSV